MITMNIQKQAYDLLLLYSRQLHLNNTQYNRIFEISEEMAVNPDHQMWKRINSIIDKQNES